MSDHQKTKIRAAEAAGRRNGLERNGRPCWRCLKDRHGFGEEEAAAWASAHFQACRGRKTYPEFTCGCYSSPFES